MVSRLLGILILLWGMAQGLVAQTVWTDSVYYANFKSVRMVANNIETILPAIELNNGSLRLEFDDADADVTNYYYTITHCNADWTPTQGLAFTDYINGFQEEQINEFQYSLGVVVPYTHYTLTLPNQNTKFLKSGNYVIKVFPFGEPDNILFTRRFIIVQNNVVMESNIHRASMGSDLINSQELSLTLRYPNLQINSPERELKVLVLQNGRWQSGQWAKQPTFAGPNFLTYQGFGMFNFPGGKEFRSIDSRSLRFSSINTEQVIETKKSWKVIQKPDFPRTNEAYMFYRDLNGFYFIDGYTLQNKTIQTDYAEVYLTLKTQQRGDGDVYILGRFNDFVPSEQCKMSYNKSQGQYEGMLLLKQGFYDYQYALVKPKSNKVDFTALEGSSYDTDNDYQILVYYRPFGAFYDQVIGLKVTSFRSQNGLKID